MTTILLPDGRPSPRVDVLEERQRREDPRELLARDVQRPVVRGADRQEDRLVPLLEQRLGEVLDADLAAAHPRDVEVPEPRAVRLHVGVGHPVGGDRLHEAADARLLLEDGHRSSPGCRAPRRPSCPAGPPPTTATRWCFGFARRRRRGPACRSRARRASGAGWRSGRPSSSRRRNPRSSGSRPCRGSVASGLSAA